MDLCILISFCMLWVILQFFSFLCIFSIFPCLYSNIEALFSIWILLSSLYFQHFWKYMFLSSGCFDLWTKSLWLGAVPPSLDFWKCVLSVVNAEEWIEGSEWPSPPPSTLAGRSPLLSVQWDVLIMTFSIITASHPLMRCTQCLRLAHSGYGPHSHQHIYHTEIGAVLCVPRDNT